MNDITFDKIIDKFEKSSISELEVTYKDLQVKCKRVCSSSSQKNLIIDSPPLETIKKEVVQTVQEEEKINNCEEKIISAPIVGTFYCSPTPDANPYVSIGDKVKKGDTLCILEAMKMMNELVAEEDCTITEIIAQQGILVEFGQPIFKVSL